MASARNRYGGTGTPTGAGALSAARAITQSAAGIPSHVAPKNALYRNESTGILYINTDGATTWVAVGSGTGTIGQTGRPGEDGRDGEDSYVPGPPGPKGDTGNAGGTGAAGADGRMGPPGWDAEPAEDFGLWLPPSVPASRSYRATSGLLLPTGALFDTHPRTQAVLENTSPVLNGQVSFVAIDLPIDTIVSSITFLSGATGHSPMTHQWFGLYDLSKNRLAQSADDTSTAWASRSTKTLAMTTPWRTTYSGYHLLAILINGTVGNMIGTGTFATILALAPNLAFRAESGITTLPNPSSAGITTSTTIMYAYVS